MKRLTILLFTATLGWGQGTALTSALPGSPRLNERNVTVTKTDIYCGGYLSPQAISRDVYVAAGPQYPTQLYYSRGDVLFLRGSYAPGTQVSIVREMVDPNRYVPFPKARDLMKKTGAMYGEMGYATVIANRGAGLALAKVDFACESITPGDLVIPFTAKITVTAREHSVLDQFPANTPKLSGSIIAARDFEEYVGAGKKVYLSVGANQGVKPGDYLRIVRNFELQSLDPADRQEYHQMLRDDSQHDPPHLPRERLGDLPRQVVGEVIVLNARPGSSTAMITFSVADIQVGDVVELEETQ